MKLPRIKIFTSNDSEALEKLVNKFIELNVISEIVSIDYSYFGKKESVYHSVVLTFKI